MTELPIDQAPRDGRLCLIGGGCDETSLYPSFRAWAWFDANKNAWREAGVNGMTIRNHIVKFYYPFPFGNPAAHG